MTEPARGGQKGSEILEGGRDEKNGKGVRPVSGVSENKNNGKKHESR